MCAVLVVLLCAPAQAQGPGSTGDQYAPWAMTFPKMLGTP
jgi:hypothetical protein